MWGYSFAVLITACVVGVLGSARITRLIVADSWPPVTWVKKHWDTWTAKTDRRQAWWVLPNCPWCLAPWVVLPDGFWAVLSHLHWSWWAFNGWLALSYLASMVVYHDEGKSDDEG